MTASRAVYGQNFHKSIIPARISNEIDDTTDNIPNSINGSVLIKQIALALHRIASLIMTASKLFRFMRIRMKKVSMTSEGGTGSAWVYIPPRIDTTIMRWLGGGASRLGMHRGMKTHINID